MEKSIYYSKKDLINIGYTQYKISKELAEGIIEKLSHNVYIFTSDVMVENIFYTLQKGKEFIYAGHSAAYLHGLSTANSNTKHIIVKDGYNVSRIKQLFSKKGFDLVVTYVKESVYNKIKTSIHWGDSFIRVISIPYLMMFLIKKFDKFDDWVNFEIISSFSQLLHTNKVIYEQYKNIEKIYNKEKDKLELLMRLKRW